MKFIKRILKAIFCISDYDIARQKEEWEQEDERIRYATEMGEYSAKMAQNGVYFIKNWKGR